MGVAVIEFLLPQFLGGQAVQKSNRREHIPTDFDADICRWKDLFEQASRGQWVNAQYQDSRQRSSLIWLMPGKVASKTPPGFRIRWSVFSAPRTS